jgi:hypothetical protein
MMQKAGGFAHDVFAHDTWGRGPQKRIESIQAAQRARNESRGRGGKGRAEEDELDPMDPVRRERGAKERKKEGKKERKTYARCQACVKGALASKAPPRGRGARWGGAVEGQKLLDEGAEEGAERDRAVRAAAGWVRGCGLAGGRACICHGESAGLQPCGVLLRLA